MREVRETVEEIFDRHDPVDRTEAFHDLWGVTVELLGKITSRFDVSRDPSTDDLESFRSGGRAADAAGHLAAFSGPEMDWLVHSWIGNARVGFTEMHLTAWLGPHIDVPHLAITLRTLPDLWFCVDYHPRSDLSLDPVALDRYYAPLNTEFLELRADDGLVPVTIPALAVRQGLSAVAACFTTDPRPERIDQVRRLLHGRVDRWLRYVDEAVPVPEDGRARLAAADLVRRRSVAESVPSHAMSRRFFGEEVTARLARAHSGADRAVLRPGEP